MRGAGLDLDETQYIFVPANHVNFSAAAGRAEISGDDYVTEMAEIEVGVFFAATSGVEMGRASFFRLNLVDKPIGAAEDELSKSGGHAEILTVFNEQVCDGRHNSGAVRLLLPRQH